MTTSRSRPKQTHCRRGHKWTDANSYLYLDTKGKPRRKCRQCTLDRLDRIRNTKSGIEEERARLRQKQRNYKLQVDTETGRKHEKELARVNALTALHEQLERETRAWLKPEILARIEKLRRGA